MRKVTYGGACSADGYITGPGEAIDWLRMSDDVTELMKESWKGVDTMLMGRKTWEFGQKMGGGPATPGVTSYVFSRTLDDGEFRARMPRKSARETGVELVRDDAAEFVRELKAKPGGDIILMGGGELGTRADRRRAGRRDRLFDPPGAARRRHPRVSRARPPGRARADRVADARQGLRAGAVASPELRRAVTE